MPVQPLVRYASSDNVYKLITDIPHRNDDIGLDTMDIAQSDIVDKLEQERIKCSFQEQILTQEIELRKMLKYLLLHILYLVQFMQLHL